MSLTINTELTDDEKDILLMALGMATGGILKSTMFSKDHALRLLVVTNKLFAGSPDFRPYDTTSFDDFYSRLFGPRIISRERAN